MKLTALGLTKHQGRAPNRTRGAKTHAKKIPHSVVGDRAREKEKELWIVDHYRATTGETSRPAAEPPRCRFSRFGANGLYPGRRNDPSPISPEEVATAIAFL